MSDSKIKPTKETDQIIFEELIKGWTFISSEFDLEAPSRRIMEIRTDKSVLGVIKFETGGSLATRKENMKRALIDYDPTVALL